MILDGDKENQKWEPIITKWCGCIPYNSESWPPPEVAVYLEIENTFYVTTFSSVPGAYTR